MPTLIARVANCLISGHEITRRTDGSQVRDLVRFDCGDWEFRFRQRSDVVLGKIERLKGTLCETTVVEVDNVEPTRLKEVLTTLDSICWLLSFICQSHVHWYEYEFKTHPPSEFSRATVGFANHFRPLLDLHDGPALKNFVEQTYPAFRRLKTRRKLAVVFDYLVQAERPGQPSEIQLLLLFVALECLKHTYARGRYPFVNGYFQAQGPKGRRLSFRGLLVEMLRSVGMRRGVKQAVDLRDEIIHSGLSSKPYSRQRKMHERLQDMVREYLVRLLGYRGYYYTYVSQGMARTKV